MIKHGMGKLSLVLMMLTMSPSATAQERISLPDVIDQVQPGMVKIFGAGGLRRLESWQSGFIISPDGLIVTVWSYVLDSDETTVVLDDGRRLTAELIGFHPQFEIALLKTELQGHDCFNLADGASTEIGATALVFSNLYGVANGNEKCSVQRGVVSAIVPLNARRGSRAINYRGPAIILDAITSNPGAAGGVVTDRRGRFLGMVGRESRSVSSGLWLNYAIPAEQAAAAVELILAGKTSERIAPPGAPTEFMTLDLLGLVLVPNVVERTPPFVDQVISGGPAAAAGIRPDDLIVEVENHVTTSRRDLIDQLRDVDRDSELSILVQRNGEFLNLTLKVHGR